MESTRVFIVSLALLAGCAGDPVTYQVAADGKAQSKQDAERAHASAPLKLTDPEEADLAPQVVSSTLPEYPREWRSAGITGSVEVRFTIGVDGTVSNPTVEGSPQPELAAISLQAILRWKFSPATRKGRPVAVRAKQIFVFRIR